MNFNFEQRYWASVYSNQDFICIETVSGLRRTATDPMGAAFLLPTESREELLGENILLALSQSRTLTPDEIGEFFSLTTIEKNYQAWITKLMDTYHYKNKRLLFKNMKRCSIECYKGRIKISPSFHEKLEAWSGDGLSEEDNVILPIDSTPEEIGAGLRLAMSRCR